MFYFSLAKEGVLMFSVRRSKTWISYVTTVCYAPQRYKHQNYVTTVCYASQRYKHQNYVTIVCYAPQRYKHTYIYPYWHVHTYTYTYTSVMHQNYWQWREHIIDQLIMVGLHIISDFNVLLVSGFIPSCLASIKCWSLSGPWFIIGQWLMNLSW